MTTPTITFDFEDAGTLTISGSTYVINYGTLTLNRDTFEYISGNIYFTIDGFGPLPFYGDTSEIEGFIVPETGEIQILLATGLPFFTGTSGSLTGSHYNPETGQATFVQEAFSAVLTVGVTLTPFDDGEGEGSGDTGSGSGSGSGDTSEPDFYSAISGWVGVTGNLEFQPESSITANVGVTGWVRRPRTTIDRPDVDELPVGFPDDQIDGFTSTAVRRRVVVVDMDGVPVTGGFLAEATHGPITWTRSTPASFSVTVPLYSQEAALILGNGDDRGIETPYREVQLWRGDQLLTWGPVVSTSVDGDSLELTGADVAWYLTRRSIGPSKRINLFTNGDLNNGFTGWFNSVQRGWGNPPQAATAIDANISRVRLPSDSTKWALRLEDRSPYFQDINNIEITVDPTTYPTWVTAQSFFTIPPQPVGTSITLSCWMTVDELISTNDDDSPLFIGLFPAGARTLEDLVAVEFASFPNDIVAGRPFRAEVTVDIPAGQFVWGVASVRPPKGVAHAWDFWLEWDGGLSYVAQDKALIMRDLVRHLTGNPTQGSQQARQYPLRPFHGPTSYGKSNVKIEPSVAMSGYRLTRLYPFSAGGGDGIGALTALAEDDATSGWQTVVSDTKRWWHAMRNLGVRWDCPIRWVPSGGNLTAFGWQFMGEQGANVVNVFSAIPNSRGQATAIDTHSFGGLTLEDSFTAVEDTWDEDLPQWAATHLQGTTKPVALAAKLPAAPYFTRYGLGVGQVVPVTIRHGALKISGFYRIHSMSLTPDDYLELTLTPAYLPGVSIT